ncbi:MAG: hypothetical protein K6B67_05630 [Lachnospiraceae bacterium]|nr:hypothetical protein [Lachnospiraceae bacterium]
MFKTITIIALIAALITGFIFIVIGVAINILKNNDKGMTLTYVGILLIAGGITTSLWIVMFLQNIT